MPGSGRRQARRRSRRARWRDRQAPSATNPSRASPSRDREQRRRGRKERNASRRAQRRRARRRAEAQGRAPLETARSNRRRRGKAARGTSKIARSSSSHVARTTSKSCVREALPASTTASPPKRDSRNASMVPMQTSPALARAWPCGKLSKSQRAFAAENMGSSGKPLLRRMGSPQPLLRSEAQIGSVRWSCQDNTGVSASPLRRSQTTQDSRCVLRPTDTTRLAVSASRASLTARLTLPQISSASLFHPTRLGGCEGDGSLSARDYRAAAVDNQSFG